MLIHHFLIRFCTLLIQIDTWKVQEQCDKANIVVILLRVVSYKILLLFGIEKRMCYTNIVWVNSTTTSSNTNTRADMKAIFPLI